jgi:nicotinamidase-related amidase
MKTALLIIDVQNDYFEGGKCELINPKEALANVEYVLNYFREKSQTIIHVQHINDNNAITYFYPNTEGAEINERVKPKMGEYVVNKNDPNCFFKTNLRDIIKNENISTLVICGMMTHMCIDTTVRACRYEGVKVILLKDACATRDLELDGKVIPAKTVHETFIAALNKRFAEVIATSFIKEDMLKK